jgi:ribosome-binding factor A
MVTVTAVEVTRDLRQATIFVSILGSDEERATTMEGLESLSAHLRAHLGRELKLRSAPEIVFKLDLSVARAARIHELLHGLARDRRETDEPQSGIDPAAGEER